MQIIRPALDTFIKIKSVIQSGTDTSGQCPGIERLRDFQFCLTKNSMKKDVYLAVLYIVISCNILEDLMFQN